MNRRPGLSAGRHSIYSKASFHGSARNLGRRVHDRRKDKVITVNSNVIIVSVHTIEYTSVQHGYIVLLKKFTDLEQEQYKIRRQVMSKGHAAKYTFDDIVGNSLVIRQTKQLAGKMACSNSAVLIYGQTGTGKELFAQSIHNASPRRNYPFIAINCSAIPENLLESELFGYAEGAFTGARKRRKIRIL